MMAHRVQDLDRVPDRPTATPRSSSRRSRQPASTVKNEHTADSAPSHSPANVVQEQSNPFLSQSTQKPRSLQRQRQPAHTSLEAEGDSNPFLATSRPVSTRNKPIVNQPAEQDTSIHIDADISSASQKSQQSPSISTTPQHRYVLSAESSSVSLPKMKQDRYWVPDSNAVSNHGSGSNRSEHTLDLKSVSQEDLKRVKKELKLWEAKFKAKYQRTATQDDIARDEVMVKKYRTYGKIKKALAAKEVKQADHIIEPSGSAAGVAYASSRDDDVPRTPKKPTRTRQISVARTPSMKQEIEFVSPRKVMNTVGFMSPSRGNKHGEDRHQFLSNISSPKTQRTALCLSPPSNGGSRKSLLGSPSFRSPSGLFTIQEQGNGGTGSATHASSSSVLSPTTRVVDNLSLTGMTIPNRQPRTPTSRRIESLYLPNPFHSPSRSRTSPLFGGMNHRRPKRITRPSAPVLEDLEPEPEPEHVSSRSPRPLADDLGPDALFMRSPLFSTPQKSGAAKAARSLFRRPSVTYPTSPSSRLSVPSVRLSQGSPTLSLGDRVNGARAYEADSPFAPSPATYNQRKLSSEQESFQDAMDSMTIREPQALSDVLSHSHGRFVQGFDIEDQWGDVDGARQPQDGSAERALQGSVSPSYVRHAQPKTTPRTPSQQPSLTFSQTTPGSARSEADIMLVPPGFHSHFRRRPIRSTLFMASQEDDERFEREFLGPKSAGLSNAVHEVDNISGEQAVERDEGSAAIASRVENGAPDDESYWEEQQDSQGEDKLPFGPERRPPPKKKYTQKRTTRLHRIVVAPSEKVEAARASKAPSRGRKAAKSNESEPVMLNGENEQAASDQEHDEAEEHGPESKARKETEGFSEAISDKEKPNSAKESTPYGWGNSNKPMVKSDRRIPGVGQGRAGPRRPVASKYGAPASEGNFVAYNLQRGGFRKGGARGKSRFGGSKFGGGYGAGGLGTGRTLFDDESWRSEFDKDFNEAALAMSFADGGMSVEDEEEDDDGLPWYGHVYDVTDPHVVTISKKYLRAQVGDADDPEEYVNELELHSFSSVSDASQKDMSQVRVNLEHVLKRVWGYPSFRDGQLNSIKRILRYESSLLVLPTGSGKSLSYQLPAYIFSKLGIPSLTLVISPMISLMYDQVKCLPPGLNGACWTSVEQSASQFKDFMERLTSNAIKILFISPEKLQSQSFLSLVRTRRIPRISFFCVDEVHCLSEWSHNFRPAYLLLNHVLKTDLKSPCVLGLTGTATEGTKDSICAMLDIDRRTGVLSGPVIRENLAMTVSLEVDREPALLHLLQSPRFASMGSILIYVMKQAQADALAGFLRVRNFSAESYHAGKSPLDRQRIQHRFMSDSSQKGVSGSNIGGAVPISTGSSSTGIRILVATIAFGLGLNKSNIRSVIHYCMPKSLENYIQEIGRSGRDGAKAYCHMFLNQDDYLRLRSLAYADGMDWGSIMRLVKKLFSRRGIISSSSSAGEPALTGKKRRGAFKNNGDEDDRSGNDNPQEECLARPGPKKRKQNDRQGLNVNLPKTGNTVQDLIMSAASILVIPPTSGMSSQNGGKRLVAVREELVEEEFDIKKEVLATLLSYIELDPSHSIKVLGSIQAKCTVKFLQTSNALSEMADKIPLVDMIMKQGVLTGHNSNNGSSYGKGRKGSKTGIAGTTLSMAYCCDTISLCQQSDMSYTELVQELQLWKRKKWAVYEMTDPSLSVEILKEPAECMAAQRKERSRGLSGADMDIDEAVQDCETDEENQDPEAREKDHDDFIVALTDRLHRKLCAVERVGVAKVDRVYELFQSVATPTWQEQEVFQPKAQASEQDEDDELNEHAGVIADDNDDGELSSEYDEDADPAYIFMRAEAKARARTAKKDREASKTFGIRGGPSQAEMILRYGIQEYFARSSGEGIGGLDAEQELFRQSATADQVEEGQNRPVSGADKTIQLYSYESAIVTSLQRKWRSAVEVDLKVFLNQLWQQQQQQEQEQSMSEYGRGTRGIVESPRVVSRIFHGISSPCYSALEWSRHKYWAKYLHFDFAQLMQMADRIIKEQRRQRLSQRQQQQE